MNSNFFLHEILKSVHLFLQDCDKVDDKLLRMERLTNSYHLKRFLTNITAGCVNYIHTIVHQTSEAFRRLTLRLC